MGLSRRRFLQAAGAASLATVTTRSLGALATETATSALPAGSASGIEHVVVLCMENRSFDHYLGWLAGADGRQSGLAYADDRGAVHETRRWPDRTGCGYRDPDHSYEGGRVQLNGGACDGFARGANDDYALSYYVREDLPATASIADRFTVCDRYFCSILGPTFPNRLYTHSAATDRIENTMDTCTLPTIWDRLGAAGVPAAYYFSDLPVLGLYGTKYLHLGRRFEQFYVDAAAGTLPAYSYLDPFFLGEEQGGSNDDHPHADIWRGQALISAVANALITSPLWASTALVVTYDEWGGFFDHVAPPRLPDDVDNPGGDATNPDHAQAGFRVPTMVISPFAPIGGVPHGVYDHASILKLVEWRFGLAPLTKRDAAANNLAGVLDFSAPNAGATPVTAVADPGPHLCIEGQALGAPAASTPVHTGLAGEDPFWAEFAQLPSLRSWGAIG